MIQPGDVFNSWEVIEYAGRGKSSTKLWKCKCTCGTEKVVRQDHLRSGASTSCGCSRLPCKPVEPGDRFFLWTVLAAADRDTLGRKRWLCRCACGTERSVDHRKLLGGETHGCGCPARVLKEPGSLLSDSEAKKAYNKWYKTLHAKRLKIDRKKHNAERPEVARSNNSSNRARRRGATPIWAKAAAAVKTQELARDALEIEASTGVKMHIDHIVPLKGKIGTKHVVCGLHVAANLRLLPASDNCVKSCYSWPDMW